MNNDQLPPKDKTYWLVYFEDAGVRPVVFTDESAAREYYRERSISWNCHLFVRISEQLTDEVKP